MIKNLLNNILLTSVLLGLLYIQNCHAGKNLQLLGVNLAGAEFDHGTFWPNSLEFDYFKSKGMNVFRIPFRWERLQPQLNMPFDQQQLSDLITVVNLATQDGTFAIIDPHNYARYQGQLIGSSHVSHQDFAGMWTQLATIFKDNPRVIFGLMNEPHSMPTEQWRDSANQAIAAIRAVGADQLILVPGNAWTGAHSWTQNWYGTPNSEVMLSIVDPLNHYAFELHQYFDGNFSGTSPQCSSGHGSSQLEGVTNWLRSHNKMGFLGEFGGANNTACEASINTALSYMNTNDDVWLGWSWWAAGPEWGEYIFTLEPTNDFSTDRPQMKWLSPYLSNINTDVIFENDFE